jgi:thioredoxin-dependent adenylylsulfate APS reductase
MQERVLLDEHECVELAAECDGYSPQEILRRVLTRFQPRIAICTSFQASGMVILDMAWRLHPEVRVFTIDTGRLPQETYDLMERVRERYGVQIEVYFPDASQVEHMVHKYGTNLFYRDAELRLLCCQVRKVQPLRRVLSTLDAWITGLRREQGPTREQVGKVEVDHEHGGIIKVNPLADWTEEDTWEYIRTYNVPYHAFYDRGYTSIGCAPCTRPTQPGEDPRAGRWWWEHGTPKECGLHYPMELEGRGMDSAGQTVYGLVAKRQNSEANSS